MYIKSRFLSTETAVVQPTVVMTLVIREGWFFDEKKNIV